MTNGEVIEAIHKHIPSLSEMDEQRIYSGISRLLSLDEKADVADLALRTCMCGESIDGYYGYVDHLTAIFGGESHFGG